MNIDLLRYEAVVYQGDGGFWCWYVIVTDGEEVNTLNYGVADTKEEAEEFAQKKLEYWSK